MKQRAIKRCIKRTQAKLRRNTYKGRRITFTLDTEGMIFTPTPTCLIKASNGDVFFGVRILNAWHGEHHIHWLGNTKTPVAVSYAK